MQSKVYETPGKLLVEWDSETKAIINTWSTYAITLAEFKDAILIKGINHAEANEAKAWIIDTNALGDFGIEIQNFIATQIFPAFVRIGMQFFITINSESTLTNLSVKQYSAIVDTTGLKIIKASNVSGAIDWLKKNT